MQAYQGLEHALEKDFPFLKFFFSVVSMAQVRHMKELYTYVNRKAHTGGYQTSQSSLA